MSLDSDQTTKQTAKPFRLNWGHGLLIFLVAFLLTMVGIVYYASRQDNPMMDSNYYEKELAYQGIIDAQKNLLILTSLSIIHQTPADVVVNLPTGSFEQFQPVGIEMLRRDVEHLDVHLSQAPDTTGTIKIPKSGLKLGMYTMRVSWSNNSTPYYCEEGVYVDK
ncbi:MAG TPA: FixH family protein [Saprospiraceae bacterium]|nr:FixH family protein [Saprospiraceae bacterium]